MPNITLFRVIGIRPNGLPVPMGFGLTSEEAKRIRESLAEAKVFETIQIEVDTDSDPVPPVAIGP